MAISGCLEEPHVLTCSAIYGNTIFMVTAGHGSVEVRMPITILCSKEKAFLIAMQTQAQEYSRQAGLTLPATSGYSGVRVMAGRRALNLSIIYGSMMWPQTNGPLLREKVLSIRMWFTVPEVSQPTKIILVAQLISPVGKIRMVTSGYLVVVPLQAYLTRHGNSQHAVAK